MFAKLKKKITDEAGNTSRPGMGRIPRSVSRDSITSVGADSGDDIASDSSCSREDLLSQLLRRNDQVRKLEVKLSDYAEQLRNLQKTKEKLELALEKHQDSSMRKLQEQNETYQANRAKMAEGMALALEKKDQDWMLKVSILEKEKAMFENQLKQMKDHSLNLFQKRDEQDELDGFQQQELAKVKHMLLRKEEMLSNFERELEERKTELDQTKEELKVSNQKLLNQDKRLEQLLTLNADINKEREEFVATKRSAEGKITVLECRARELQNVIQRLSADLHKASAETEEKGKVIEHLQAKVFSLEKRLEGNYSEDEHVQDLLKEKSYLEQKLEETRHHLLEAKTSHTEAVSILKTQIAKLNNEVVEIQTLMKQKDDEMQAVKDENATQISELEQRLNLTKGKLILKENDVNEKEVQIKKLQEESEAESDRLQHQIATLKHQHTERTNRVDAQIAALETAREFDKTASQHKISQCQQKNEELSDRLNETENALRKVECELERSKEELNSRETINAEIAKTLEGTRQQKEELQHKVLKLTEMLDEKNTSVLQKDKELIKMQEDFKKLEQDHEAVMSQTHQLQMESKTSEGSSAEREGAVQSQLSGLKLQLIERQELLEASQRKVKDLEAEVMALNGQLHPSENDEKGQNGEVTIAYTVQLQQDNQDLEQQLIEKNKTIKQLLQRLTELKKTLQKELKMKPELEPAEVRERSYFEPPASINNSTTVVNNSDLNDSKEINFEYLKHVLLKFMSVRESEAYQLVKAVSMLLNFTREEENLLKESLEYKMSWFGSKPTPKGIVRPSITGRPPPHWQ
ncbi:golgin subfamily A member 1 isoform X1 [Carcharodon carcharias]|uniref:golgin subfamily A member 1 isoform X1 n=2 Tax=Carcharodon carcharias TaxID=13397 RepID=UPI001B7EB491|nr:golgin subfamily A member 1 isoform X1 [Carcharodon carcharias]